MTYKTAMIILPLLLAFVAFRKNMISAEEPPRCPATASQRSIYGMMLKGHVYKTAMAGIGLECVLMCRTDDRCQSFNFVISRHLCEFNDRTKEARPKDFVADPDRYYYTKDINRVPLGSISDLAAESCKEIKASDPQTTSGNFWLSTIKRGMVLQAYCDMKTFDVDECSASSPVCDKNGICNNTVGSYNCTCKQGYSSAEGKRCKDIDECQISSPCHVNATCRNSDGSYSCSCNYGFEGDGKSCNVNLTLSSAILNKVQGKYLEQLKTFLYPVLQSAPPIKFVRCWHAQTDGWAASTFHSNCDGKGPTVTIIQVGSYIFGGYTDKSWARWMKYSQNTTWCTSAGRSLISRYVNITQCQRYCEARVGCNAIEYWEGGSRFCHECTDTSKITPFNNANDGAYPVYVWIKSSCAHVSSSKSFIYSLYNVNGYHPFKLQIKSGHEGNAIYTCNSYGPTFGGGHDIHIANDAASNQGSYFNCDSSYHLPPGYSSASSSCQASFAGSYSFTPTDIEVFYETTA